MHHCPYCQRGYSRKIYFDRHIGICELLCKSKKERKLDFEERVDMPDVRDLYAVVMELVVKNRQLEEKVQELSKWCNTKKNKINLIDWLMVTYTSATDYVSWFNELHITRADLKILFETDYVGGIISALKQQVLLHDEARPLRAFDSKDNTFYLYNEKKWTLMDDETYTKLMYDLDKKMMIEFGNWQKENKDKIYSDEFSLVYNKYMKKTMVTREPMYARIRKELYNHLRTKAPQ